MEQKTSDTIDNALIASNEGRIVLGNLLKAHNIDIKNLSEALQNGEQILINIKEDIIKMQEVFNNVSDTEIIKKLTELYNSDLEAIALADSMGKDEISYKVEISLEGELSIISEAELKAQQIAEQVRNNNNNNNTSKTKPATNGAGKK